MFAQTPQQLSHLKEQMPELYKALEEGNDNELFKIIGDRMKEQMLKNRKEQERKLKLLNADPNDAEAQKQIEEEIRKAAI